MKLEIIEAAENELNEALVTIKKLSQTLASA